MLSKLPQNLFKGLHSNDWTAALRAIPSDIVLTITEEQLSLLVVSIHNYAVSTHTKTEK